MGKRGHGLKRVPVLCALAAGVLSCQFILGIEDREVENEDDPDAGPSNVLCDPLSQMPCQADQKCARHEPSPGVVRTECVPNGTVPDGGTCNDDAPFDNCQRGLSCSRGVCRPNCAVEHFACGSSETCRNGFDAFPDHLDVGVCDLRCDSTFQDCPPGEACFANRQVLENQCRPVLPAPLPGQDEPCIPGQGTNCVPNGCDLGFGPHLPDATGGPNQCAFYCFPNDTFEGVTDFANGGDPGSQPIVGSCTTDFGGVRTDGPGDIFQCRFLQTFESYAQPGEIFSPFIGICVDPRVPQWGDCSSCFAFDQESVDSSCAPGCISVDTYDSLPPSGQ